MTVATEDLALDQAIEEKIAFYFSAKTVTPAERKKLAPLLRYYAKFKKPFTKCVRDNTKRWGEELAKKRCAVIKDLIMGTTKWRKGRQSFADHDAEMFVNAPDIDDEIVALMDRLSDDEMERLEEIALEARMAVEDAETGAFFSVDDEGVPFIHLHLSDNTPVEEEEITLSDGKRAKVLWKDVLVEGEYPMSPTSNGASDTPMRVIAEGESDLATKTISMSDLADAHKDGAFKYVTIPTSHKDGLLDNTGYVPRPDGTRVVEKKGKKVFQAALGFTEPDIKGKVQRGTIPDVSAGIFFNWLNKHTKKRYRCAMKHVALTGVPFMGNLDGFPAVFASDDEIPKSTNVEIYDFGDAAAYFDTVSSNDTPAGSEGSSDSTSAEIVWNEKDGAGWLSSQLNEALRPESQPEDGRPFVPQPSYYVNDVSPTKKLALVEEYFKGDRTRYVIPFTVDGDEVKPAPATRWVAVREAMIAASDKTFEELSTAKLKERLTLALGEELGKTDTVYRVDDITTDGRMRIVNRGLGKAWTVEFALFDDAVWIAPVDQWEGIKLSDVPDTTVTQPAVANKGSKAASKAPSVVKLADNDSENRLAAARQRRRQMLASSK